jgi:hypothetical protein
MERGSREKAGGLQEPGWLAVHDVHDLNLSAKDTVCAGQANAEGRLRGHGTSDIVSAVPDPEVLSVLSASHRENILFIIRKHLYKSGSMACAYEKVTFER